MNDQAAYLNADLEKRAAVRAAVQRADAGYLIPGEDVHAWMASWDTSDELPMPTLLWDNRQPPRSA